MGRVIDVSYTLDGRTDEEKFKNCVDCLLLWSRGVTINGGGEEEEATIDNCLVIIEQILGIKPNNNS